jgi:transcriptional regulator with XRE-family HTH domain
MPRLFGAKLRYLRQQQHLTQTDLAHALTLATHTHISQMESLIRTPSLALVVTIAAYFGVTTDYLLRDTVPIDAPVSISLPDGSAYKAGHERRFGAKLRHLRGRHHISQTALGKQLALTTHTHISHLEAGRKEPSIDLVLRIADIFGVTTDYLLRDSLPIDEPTVGGNPGT